MLVPASRTTRRLSSLRRLCLALLLVCTPATAQIIHLPSGQAFEILHGPSIAFRVLRAVDGSGESRFVLHAKMPGVVPRMSVLRGGLRLSLKATLSSPELGSIPIEAELDAIKDQGLSWNLVARITKVPAALAVSTLGIEFDVLDVAGDQALLVPVFSGGEFVEPADSIPVGRPVDTGFAHSVQATAYYGADGTGLLMFALDPKGTKPKRFFYESGRLTNPERKTISFALEYYLPSTNVGGAAAQTPVPTGIAPYSYRPELMDGWFAAAKTYRAWIERHGRGPGGILEKGRLEDRTDTPKWMKEVDLLISEQFGWFPELSLLPLPLLELLRLKAFLQADNVIVGLFFWGDRSPAAMFRGTTGSWYPPPATVFQMQALLGAGVRTTGYTFPGAFDLRNPFLLSQGLTTEFVEDRALTPQTIPAAEPLVQMDVASAKLADWYEELGTFHASQSFMSGFYSDLPVAAGRADFGRPPGQEQGVSESGYLGYRRILERTIRGANKVGREFVQYHEVSFEWLIPVANFGQGAVGVIGRAFKDEDRTRGVPFFQAVYSGYTNFWPAEEGLGLQTLLFVPDAYGDLTKHNITRLLAEGFTWGGILNHSEAFLPFGRIIIDPPPIPLPPDIIAAFFHHANTLKTLIQLRREARPWVAFGEMLNDPVVGGDTVDIVVKRPFDNQFFDQTFTKPAVPTRAFRAKDGSIRLLAANGGTTPATVVLNLRRIGIWFARGLEDVKSGETFLADRKTDDIPVVVAGGTGRQLKPLLPPDR